MNWIKLNWMTFIKWNNRIHSHRYGTYFQIYCIWFLDGDDQFIIALAATAFDIDLRTIWRPAFFSGDFRTFGNAPQLALAMHSFSRHFTSNRQSENSSQIFFIRKKNTKWLLQNANLRLDNWCIQKSLVSHHGPVALLILNQQMEKPKRLYAILAGMKTCK